jgi:hypothetical protein
LRPGRLVGGAPTKILERGFKNSAAS